MEDRERDEVKDGKEAGRQHKRLRRRQRERVTDRRIIGGDELLERTLLGGCFCCCWQAEQGPHVEAITRQTLPDSIIHRLGHVSQTHTD